jgi:hypothetical protein
MTIDLRQVRDDEAGRALFASALRRFNDTHLLSETTAGVIFSETQQRLQRANQGARIANTK